MAVAMLSLSCGLGPAGGRAAIGGPAGPAGLIPGLDIGCWVGGPTGFMAGRETCGPPGATGRIAVVGGPTGATPGRLPDAVG
jgi:hypothetical protein